MLAVLREHDCRVFLKVRVRIRVGNVTHSTQSHAYCTLGHLGKSSRRRNSVRSRIGVRVGVRVTFRVPVTVTVTATRITVKITVRVTATATVRVEESVLRCMNSY